ncbi:MAG: sialidase family protein [Kiritimatiellae bacterium]|nr:sialidase family protein [Kiritimatiellia bacterium]
MKQTAIWSIAILLGIGIGHAQDKAPSDIHGAAKQQKRAELIWTKVLCKEPGRYIGWPTVCLRKNGELLAVFSGDRDGHICPWGKVQLVRSTDMGETWSPPVTICNTILDDRDAGIMELPDGTLLVTWFTSTAYLQQICEGKKIKPDSPQFFWRLHDEKIRDLVKPEDLGAFTTRSTDGGKTWEKAVMTKGSTPHGPILLKDGRLLYVGRFYRDNDCVISVEESRDSGKSWQKISEIKPLPGEKKLKMYHEPHAVETTDGRIVALIRYHGTGYPMLQSESSDGGKSWTVMEKSPMAGLPPHLIRLRNGKIINVYGRRFDAFGEYACISDDQGRTWDVANEIKLAGHFSGDLGYPASTELPDGSILTIYYQAEKKGEKTSLMGTKWRVK